MKLVCTRKNLLQGLLATTRIISSGNTLPILNNILLKTENGRLKLASTNLEMAVNTWVGGQIEEEGELTIPARLFTDYINNLPTEKVSINTQDHTLFIDAERSQTHIKGLPSEEFPLIPQIKDPTYAKIDGKGLHNGLKQVVFAAAFSETQPEISGVLFSFEGRSLTLAATDRYRLAESQIDLLEEITTPKQVIIPSRAVNELGRLVSDGVVETFLTEGQISFRTPDIELISRLIEGQYPDYRQIIPKSFTTEAEISTGEFIQALRASSLFAAENNNIELAIEPADKQVVVKSGATQTGDSEIRLDATILGERNSIIFNYRYLLECLGNLSDQKIILKLINSSSPAAIVPQDRENYVYIVMPIKL